MRRGGRSCSGRPTSPGPEEAADRRGSRGVAGTGSPEFHRVPLPAPGGARGSGATLPDGGIHVEGVMETMDGEILKIAIRKFFR